MESTNDYDVVRNMTLLFFLERLLERGQPRSLHDLSCQFGSKGFTKTMRQIAGGSQSGLKKFLSQYPSVFTVDGDFVTAAVLTGPDSNRNQKSTNGKRDYEQEAVEYFHNKMQQYGAGIEVPLRSLLGHRSQASPEIRHITGQHIREFRDFLERHPEVFIMHDESIFLKEYEGMEIKPFKELEQPKLDPELTNKFLVYFRMFVERNGPKHVEELLEAVTKSYPRESWVNLFSTSHDLTTFFKLHSNIFHVQANIVDIIPYNLRKAAETNEAPLTNRAQEPCSLSPPSSLQSSHEKQSLKQRVNSIVMKTLAENTGRDRAPAGHESPTKEVSSPSKMRVLQSTRVISSTKESVAVVNDILGSQKVVSLDLEGVNVGGGNGEVTLAVIGLPSGLIYIFDLITCPAIMSHGMLASLIMSKEVVKVCHDCKNDSAALNLGWNVKLENVFDTQAAHAVIQLQETGRAVHKVKTTSLNAMCENYDLPTNPFKELVKTIYKRDQRFWARRPLTRDMILYAAYDVMPLVPHLYDLLNTAVKPEFRPLLEELCAENLLALLQPDEVKRSKKERKMDMEVLELRQRLAAVQGKGIVLSNREIRLLRHLDLTEDEREKLDGSYKVAKKLEKLQSKKQDQQQNSLGSTNDEVNYCNQSPNADGESRSLDSQGSSEKTSPETSLIGSNGCPLSPSSSVRSPYSSLSLTASMQLVDEILSDQRIEKMDKIERLEAILSAATASSPSSITLSSSELSSSCCNCDCHSTTKYVLQRDSLPGRYITEVGCQTLSTGDIVITKVYFPEGDTSASEICLTPSPKKTKPTQFQ
ncbi:egalitarian protein homolog [Daphnia magna]|uniref:egalitarian protein homolog n=1 Tax=Daphnia magna TaxID=35525 RepID=UPI001E1BD8E8|nr:egalitarian protein homolog [Daphnia magna]